MRPLRESDQEAIEAINAATYGGQDYIASAFAGWLKSQEAGDLWTLGVEDGDGNLAGLEVLSPHDGGKTGWLDALRVHPDFRRKGLAQLIQQRLVDVAFELKFERVRFVTSSVISASRRLGALCGLTTVAEWGLLFPCGDISSSRVGQTGDDGVMVLLKYAATVREALKSVGPAIPVDANRELSIDELMAYSKHMGEAHLIQTFKAYDWTPENLKLLFGMLQRPMASMCEEDQIQSFSWAKYSRDATGLTAFVTLYSGCDDIVGILSHLAAQLDAALSAGAGSVIVTYPFKSEEQLYCLGLSDRSVHGLDGPDPVAKRAMLFQRTFDPAI